MTKKLKFILLLLLSVTSVFFAEVISGSMKYPLYDAWGIFIVIPLYGLHTIVLLYIIKKYLGNRTVMFATLYFAGAIFGLYEAYLTKVLWVGLGPDNPFIFEIAWMDFVVLVFLWHPLFAFIIPALVFEGFMTKDKYLFNGLPKFIKNMLGSTAGKVFLFVMIGLFLSLNGIGPFEVAKSVCFNAFPIVLLYFVLRKKEVHLKYSLMEILPDKKEFRICIGILVVMYLFMGAFVYGEVLTFSRQLVIWIIYLIIGLIFYWKLRRNRKVAEAIYEKEEIDFEYLIIYLILLTIVGAAISALWVYGYRDTITFIVWLYWLFFGFVLFGYNLLKKSTI